MKIGILTFWESENNYGQLLQVFALQLFLTNIVEVEVIRYNRIPHRGERLGLVRRAKLHLRGLLKELRLSRRERSRRRKFNRFRLENLNLSRHRFSDAHALGSYGQGVDAVVIGSDQVWNTGYNVPVDAFLGLTLPDSIKLISYAASFGTLPGSEEDRRKFARSLPRFTAIGVREEVGVSICWEVAGMDATLVPDPTLLIGRDDWLARLRLNEPPSQGDGLFYYTLGHAEQCVRRGIDRMLSERTDVFHVSGNFDKTGEEYPSIEEWLNRIAESKFVVTDSYHCIVFAVLFRKSCIFMCAPENKSLSNSRVGSLMRYLGLEGRMITGATADTAMEVLNAEIDWNKVDAAVARFRAKGKAFLEHALLSNGLGQRGPRVCSGKTEKRMSV